MDMPSIPYDVPENIVYLLWEHMNFDEMSDFLRARRHELQDRTLLDVIKAGPSEDVAIATLLRFLNNNE